MRCFCVCILACLTLISASPGCSFAATINTTIASTDMPQQIQSDFEDFALHNPLVKKHSKLHVIDITEGKTLFLGLGLCDINGSQHIVSFMIGKSKQARPGFSYVPLKASTGLQCMRQTALGDLYLSGIVNDRNISKVRVSYHDGRLIREVPVKYGQYVLEVIHSEEPIRPMRFVIQGVDSNGKVRYSDS